MKIVSKIAAALLPILAYAHAAYADLPPDVEEQGRALFGLSLTEDRTGQARYLKDWMSWKDASDPPQAPFKGHFKGKILVVNFWAYWCPNCIAEMGGLEKLERDIGPDKIQVILVSRPEYWARDQAFAQSHGLPFPLFFVNGNNSPQEVRSSFGDHGTLSLPQTIVYDREGQPRLMQVGGIDWDSPETLRQIRSFFAPLK